MLTNNWFSLNYVCVLGICEEKSLEGCMLSVQIWLVRHHNVHFYIFTSRVTVKMQFLRLFISDQVLESNLGWMCLAHMLFPRNHLKMKTILQPRRNINEMKDRFASVTAKMYMKSDSTLVWKEKKIVTKVEEISRCMCNE